jgi:hypothetical protein
LEDEPRSGRRVINDESVEHRILDQLAKAPPPRIRALEWHDLHLDRRQSWCVSTDPEFSRKASEIVRPYQNPPENAIILGVDESLAFKLLSGLKATSVYPTVEPSRALLTNTKGRARQRFSRRSKPPPDRLRLVITNVGDAGSSWISGMASSKPRRGKGDSCHPRQSHPQA